MQRLEDLDAFVVARSDRGALLTDFRLLTARLVQAGMMSNANANRLVRNLARAAKEADAARAAIAELLSDLIVAIETRALEDGRHIVRDAEGRVALHLASIAAPLAASSNRGRTVRELRQLLRFAAVHFGDVVVANSSRAFFADQRRQRAAVVDLAKAYAFIGSRQPMSQVVAAPRISGSVRSH